MSEIKGSNLEPILGWLMENLEPVEPKDEDAPIRASLRYIENRSGHIDY